MYLILDEMDHVEDNFAKIMPYKFSDVGYGSDKIIPDPDPT
jgi:hypothetical protein